MCDKNKLINNTSMKSMNQYLRDWKNTYENIRNEESKLYKYLCNGFPVENNVIFFDDSIEHISAVHKNCKKTTAVYLPFERPFLFKSMKNKDLNQYKKSMNSDNSYVKSSNSKMTITSSGITNEMIYLNGYTKLPSYMQRLYDWVFQTNELKNRIVIFDWDYTLNVNNGFHIFDEKNYTKSDYNKMLTDTLIYLFGGEQRFKSIKEMMKH